MTDDIDWQLLDRHLAGTASNEDEAAVRRWAAMDPRNALLLERLRQDASSPTRFDTSAAWSRVAARLDEPRRATRPILSAVARSSARPRHTTRWISAAVAVAAAAAVLFVVVRSSMDSAPPGAVAAPAAFVATVSNGRQSTITLSDGTIVRLNAGSTLRYAHDYGRSARDVQLDGEGYFEVVHDEARPFRVHARGGVAEDLGTKFVVRAYPELPRLEVAVAEGKVALRRDQPASDSALLGPGQLGGLTADGVLTVESGVDLERWMGWTHGALVLDGMTLADAAGTIGRRFDVDVVVADASLRARRLSARFNDDSLSTVLDALALALDARWTRTGRTVTIVRSAEGTR